jgi:hypothetical protein
VREETFHTIDPLTDTRWDRLLATHPDASIFHHSGWLRALAETYGFRPLVLTNGADEAGLSNGIAFCEVRSWITGARLVSLPFSDHCEPLLNGDESAAELGNWIRSESDRNRWRYVELRPLRNNSTMDREMASGKSFWFHLLDLEPSLNNIFSSLHKDSLQRRIKRAEREGLGYERGNSKELLEEFYSMLILTRMRHGLPPQPRSWFRNIVTFLRPHVQLRIARKGGQPIAALFSLVFKDKAVYKYGCSDQRFHNLAGMPFLFWKLIEESKAEGIRQLDFGRTDKENSGLTRFKDQFGTERRELVYLDYRARPREATHSSPYMDTAQRLFSFLPKSISSPLGALLYRHIA